MSDQRRQDMYKPFKTYEPKPGDLLYEAASCGDAIKVKKILANHQQNFFKCYATIASNNALHIAFINKHDEVVDIILEAIEASSTYKNVPNSFNLTHMSIACTRKSKKLIQGYLDSGANFRQAIGKNAPQWSGYNSLHFAASYQSLPAIKLLLEAGIDPRKKTNSGKTALDLMYENLAEPLIILDLLEEKTLEKHQRRNFSNFHIACLNEDVSLVQKFFDHSAANLDSTTSHELSIPSSSTPLHCAVASNCKKKVDLLLKNGAKVECPNHLGMTPLHLALYCAESKAKYDTKSHRKYDVKILQDLYAAVDDKMASQEDDNGVNFFHIAIARNDLPTVKEYLTNDMTDVNKALSMNAGKLANYTPLHMAVHFGCLEIAELLIQRGADVNVSIGKHGTPLHMAFHFGYHNFIKLFLTNNARLDVVTHLINQTMLHLIVRHVNSAFFLYEGKDQRNKLSKEDILMYLNRIVDLGVDVNAKDQNGDTALHYFRSQSQNWSTYFQGMLDLGADINVKNNEGKLPFDTIVWKFKERKAKANSIFYHHVQKLKALGLTVDPENEDICKKIAEEEDCFEKEDLICRENQRVEEIAKLKSTMIEDRMSLFDFVKLDDREGVKRYADCKALRNVAEDGELKRKFPSYGYLIQLQYRAATGFNGASVRKRGREKENGEIEEKRQRLENSTT